MKLVRVLLLAVFSGLLYSCNALETTSNSEASQIAEQIFFWFHTECGDSYYIPESPIFGGLWEIKNVSFSVREVALTESDQLNGTTWKGRVIAKSQTFRPYSDTLPPYNNGRWLDWRSGDDVHPNGVLHEFNLEKRQEQWLWNGKVIDNDLAEQYNRNRITCDQIPR
jgi:hypothetical protein